MIYQQIKPITYREVVGSATAESFHPGSEEQQLTVHFVAMFVCLASRYIQTCRAAGLRDTECTHMHHIHPCTKI